MFGNMIADTFINPFQAPVFDDPADYDLDYEDVTFYAEDNIRRKFELMLLQIHF